VWPKQRIDRRSLSLFVCHHTVVHHYMWFCQIHRPAILSLVAIVADQNTSLSFFLVTFQGITPRFLRDLHKLGGVGLRPNTYDHTVDMIIGAFFFAMRSCEYCIHTTPGRTKTLCLRHLVFRDKRMWVIPHTHPRLEQVAEYVTVTFEDQKNGIKMDSRSHRRTGDPKLCPTACLGRAVRPIVSTVPGWTKDTLLCTIRLGNKNQQITNTFTKRLLRHTCQLYGGHKTFGSHPREIGNRSIRSGAVMTLFMKDHLTAKIMILGVEIQYFAPLSSAIALL
jgi:hypothetical protein